MKIEQQSKTATEAKLVVGLEAAELQPHLSRTLNRLRQGLRVKGFRPGKAPDSLVERELGSSRVQSEVMEAAVEAAYVAAMRDQNLVPVAPPQISLKKFVPYTELEFEVTVELLPEIKLGDYQAIRLAKPETKVDPVEIERTIEDLRRREAARVEVERSAKEGDEVIIDFAGSKDGQPVRGATAKNYTLRLGSNQFIPGFEAELKGLKPGAEKTFPIRFPKDYHDAELAGQKVEFAVTLHKVSELALPELSDEFAASVGSFKNMDELRADVVGRLEASQAEAASREYETKVLDEVLKRSSYQLPPSLIAEQQERQVAELAQNLAYSGLDVEKYLQMSGKTREQLLTELRPEAERRVALALVLTEVAKAESVSVADSELDDELARLKQLYTDPATQQELDKPDSRNDIYNHLMSTRVIARLVGYAERPKSS